MKFYSIFLLVAVLFLFVSCGNDKPDKLPSSNQRKVDPKPKEAIIVAEEDEFIKELPFNIDSVTVILKEGKEGEQHILFVDNTNNPEYFKRICNFDMPTKFEISMYRNTYLGLNTEKADTLVIDLSEIINISDKWVPLVVYNEDYYYYCPAKPEYNKRVMITDSCLAVFDRHGVSAEVIQKVVNPNKNHYVLEVSALDENDIKVNKEVNIYLIDNENRIAIWEEFYPGGISYQLMIAKSEKSQFPVIVNYGQASTPEEYKFDEINYFEEINRIVE